MNSVSQFDLPIVEEFPPITVTFQQPLPSFIRFVYPTFYFSPLKKADEGDFMIKGAVNNKYLSKSFSFNVKVTNSPPYFTSALQSQIEIEQFQEKQLILPSFKDDEGQAITVSCAEKSKSSLPSFIKFDGVSSSFDLKPIIYDKAGKYTI